MADRVVLFLDAQNVYKRARSCFFDPQTAFHTKGQFDPLALGKIICQRTPPSQSKDRVLREVRIYTGRPSPRDQSYGPHMRQSAAWQNNGVTVVARSLRYPPSWPKLPAQEKGIDVALAIDFVTMAIQDEYDVGVMMSIDTDLLPAVEYVRDHSPKRAEVAAWWDNDSPRALPVNGVWCHRLEKCDYDLVADDVDYNVARARK